MSVVRLLEKLVRNFLWGDGEDERHSFFFFHLMSWEPFSFLVIMPSQAVWWPWFEKLQGDELRSSKEVA